MEMDDKSEMPIIGFASIKDWQSWLAKNYKNSNGIWLKIFKKETKVKTITYAEALDEALCYGWIDGQKKAYDEQAWLQKFCPRGAKSIWSKVNTKHIERLTKAGKMKQSGIKVVEEAKADGRWEKAYDSPSTMTVPEDFLKELGKNKKAETFFKTLNKTNIYSIVFRIQTAKKQETRLKRIEIILAMLAKGEKFH
jgi:uncharacterized protein YdeI (YjbR/CyaY-like superfamily)